MAKILGKIKELRIEHGFTSEYIAEKIDLPVGRYEYIENVDSGVITMDRLEKLAKLYHTTISYMTGWSV